MGIPILAPQASGVPIVELALTPAGVAVDDLVFSSVHKTWMRWNGTQWRLWPSATYFLHDDMFFNGAIGLVQAAISAGGLSVAPANVPRHPGQWAWSSSTTANSGRSHTNSTQGSQGSGAGLMGRWVFQSPTTINASTSIRFGFVSSVATAVVALVSGMYLEITGTSATFKTTAASTTTTSAAFTMPVSTWHTVHIVQTAAASVRCIVTRDDGTVVLDVTHTTNIPADTVGLIAAAIATNSGTTSLALLIMDAMSIGSYA